MKELLAGKADPRITDAVGSTPLQIALAAGQPKVVDLLLQQEIPIPTGVIRYVRGPETSNVRGHPSRGRAWPWGRGRWRGRGRGRGAANPFRIHVAPVMLLAARSGMPSLVEKMVDHQVPMTPSRQGFTPLHDAAGFGQAEVVSVLLDHGAAVDATTTKKWTPLMLAASRGHKEVVDRLLTFTGKVNEVTVHGSTALIEAVKQKHHDIARALLRAGADPTHLAARKDALTHALLGHDPAMAIIIASSGAWKDVEDIMSSVRHLGRHTQPYLSTMVHYLNTHPGALTASGKKQPTAKSLLEYAVAAVARHASEASQLQDLPPDLRELVFAYAVKELSLTTEQACAFADPEAELLSFSDAYNLRGTCRLLCVMVC